MVDLNGKTILVTGGCGFIGSNFIEMINEHFTNLTVVNIDKLGVGSRKNLNVSNINYTHIQSDISNVGFAYKAMYGSLSTMKFDYVFHFAAESHVDRSIDNPNQFISNNVLGTVNILDWVRAINPEANIICISTDEVYGHLNINDPPFNSDTVLNPRSPYAASKASSDLVALAYAETYGLNLVVTRCCNNYGPYQNAEKFIPTIMRHILADEEIPVYGTGENIREWIYVHDHNRAILEIAGNGYKKANKIWNIGSGVEKTNLELIDDIGFCLGKTPKIKFVEDRKAHDFRYSITNEVILEQVPYYHALLDTISFYEDFND